MACASSTSDSFVSVDGVSSRIECPVCCETFRTPKCLTCGHSVCADCCEKLKRNFSNEVQCPVCRKVTAVPSEGLPTNFALQDLIQHCQTGANDKRYQCAECGHLSNADEAWISNAKGDDANDAPRCFRCIIIKHSNKDSAATLPAVLESISDTFKRHASNLANLKRRVQSTSTEQREWTANVHQAVWVLKNRVDDIAAASDSLTTATLQDMDKTNNEFRLLNIQTDSLNVPLSLEDLNAFGRSIKETAGKLDQLAEARIRTISRANVALNSLAIGLDCLLNAGEDLKGQSEKIDDAKVANDDGNHGHASTQEGVSDLEITDEPSESPAAASISLPRHNMFSVHGPGRSGFRLYTVRLAPKRGCRGRGRPIQ